MARSLRIQFPGAFYHVRRDLIKGCILAVIGVSLCLLPFACDALVQRHYFNDFMREGVGTALSPNDKILDFKCLRGPGTDATFCRFRTSSPNNPSLYTHGELPHSAKRIIEEVHQQMNIPSALLPDVSFDAFDFAPNHKEPRSWLVVYDREQGIGWVFVSD